MDLAFEEKKKGDSGSVNRANGHARNCLKTKITG